MGLDPTPRLVIVSEDDVVFCCLRCLDLAEGSGGEHWWACGPPLTSFWYSQSLDTKTPGTQKASTEANGPETLDFIGFQAQKKTSVDVFS
jgi:hypothetical protein